MRADDCDAYYFNRGNFFLKNAVACYELGTNKRQRLVADLAYPPHLEQQEEKAATDIKHFLAFDQYRAFTSAMRGWGAEGADTQPRLVQSVTTVEFTDYYSLYLIYNIVKQHVCSLGWTSLPLSVSKIRRMHGAESGFLLELGFSNTR